MRHGAGAHPSTGPVHGSLTGGMGEPGMRESDSPVTVTVTVVAVRSTWTLGSVR